MPGTPAELLRDAGKTSLYLAVLLIIKLHEVPGRIQSPAPVLRHSFSLVHIHCSSQEAIQAEYPTSTEIYGKGECVQVRKALYLVKLCPQRQTGHVQRGRDRRTSTIQPYISPCKATFSLSPTNDRTEVAPFHWRIANFEICGLDLSFG